MTLQWFSPLFFSWMLHLVDTDDHWYDSDVRVTCCTLLPAYVWKATNCRVYSLIRHSWFAWAFVMFIGMIMTCFSKMMISLLLHSWSITNQARWLEERMNSVRATQSSHLKCYRLYACYVMLTIPDNDIFFFFWKMYFIWCYVLFRSSVFWISDS